MNTCVHLVAMPLAYPLHPSSQLGYLHGYMEGQFKERVTVRSYSAYLEILHNLKGASMTEFFERYSLLGEELLFLVCCYHAARRSLVATPNGRSFTSTLKRYNRFQRSERNISQQEITPISLQCVAALNDAMEAYLEHRFIPALRNDALNIIGFTATFCQVFGSIFAANFIRRHTSNNLLFVFGGSSFALPEATRRLQKWHVDGLMVAGSGEVPMHQIAECCLQLDPQQASEAVRAVDSKDLVNVTRVGRPRKPISLNMARTFMDTLPDPNYDEYFNSLRFLCEDQSAYEYAVSRFVSIPLEGSRGCFAKCDFCHNPDITSEFRTLEGRTVMERAVRVCERHGRNDVTFVDSVCNTWAEDYADHLLSDERSIPAFMEMRVHAPESFWTKLALCGVRSVQLGVEAISEPLLTNMRKGTKVLQNVGATKYMAELGINNPSNLIIYHPKSTVADVEETKRVLSLIEHLPIFLLSHFVLSYASPLYKELTEELKAQLVRGFDWVPAEIRDYSWPRHLSYTYPLEWMDSEVVAAWREFQDWYTAHSRRVAKSSPVFTVTRQRDELFFVDTRFGRNRRFSISGDAATIYDACHTVLSAGRVADRCELSLDATESMLDELVQRRTIIKVGDKYLSLALRPRPELVQNLRRQAAETPVRQPKRTASMVVLAGSQCG